jgi:addiction module RelE/StbE family toxin
VIKKIDYTPTFVKHFSKLPADIKSEALKKEKIFVQDSKDPRLKTHPLTGKLKGLYSFSINYQYRIMFAYDSKSEVTFIDVGTHSIYR